MYCPRKSIARRFLQEETVAPQIITEFALDGNNRYGIPVS